MKFRFTPLPTIVALIMIVVTLALGNWQIQRGKARDAAYAQRQQMQTRAAIPISDIRVDAQGQIPEGTPVKARGKYISNASVLLENRPQISGQDTRSGFIVMSPLQLEIGGKLSTTILWVARGWLERDQKHFMSTRGLQTPSGIVEIQGHLVKEINRVMQLGTEQGTQIRDTQSAELFEIRQNLDIKKYSQLKRWSNYPMVLQEDSEIRADGSSAVKDTLERNWAMPGAGADKNYGYALQWFGFALIIAVLGLFAAWRAGQARGREK